MIQLQIVGKPVPWAASKHNGRQHYDLKSKEKEYIRWQIKSQYRDEPIKGTFVLHFYFFMSIPKTTSKAKREQMLNGYIIPTSSDTSNLTKLYEDCLKKIVIEDDRYAAKVCAEKRYGDKEGVTIVIIPWEEYRGLVANQKINMC
jgi:Holliday junction resolvase RusA-like endonuclease